jgi:hypothetical protein
MFTLITETAQFSITSDEVENLIRAYGQPVRIRFTEAGAQLSWYDEAGGFAVVAPPFSNWRQLVA